MFIRLTKYGPLLLFWFNSTSKDSGKRWPCLYMLKDIHYELFFIQVIDLNIERAFSAEMELSSKVG